MSDLHDEMSFGTLIRWIHLYDKKNLTFVDCCDKIVSNFIILVLTKKKNVKGSLKNISKTRLIKFHLNTQLMTDPVYLQRFVELRDITETLPGNKLLSLTKLKRKCSRQFQCCSNSSIFV